MFILIWLGKLIFAISNLLNIGSGSTWPGHLILHLSPSFLRRFAKKYPQGIIIIAGTNGKTTTTKILSTFLKRASVKVSSNEAGANLLNGVASAFIQDSSLLGTPKSHLGILEVDENTLPLLLQEIEPNVVIILNLFRDQLDRYGEVDLIAEKWSNALKNLSDSSILILNGDDPTIANLSSNVKAKVLFFGLGDASLFQNTYQSASDSLFCPRCGARLIFEGVYFSHLGVWKCLSCNNHSPKLDLSAKDLESSLLGIYNRYNLVAAVLAAKSVGVTDVLITSAIPDISPAFGRLEEFAINGKKVRVLLSKNPTGFNESLRTVASSTEPFFGVLLALNDNIPDGRDVSWIWDVDFESFAPKWRWVVVSGTRAEDFALRLKYAGLQDIGKSLTIQKDLKKAISVGLKNISANETLNILPTYSAMLAVRKVLIGRRLL